MPEHPRGSPDRETELCLAAESMTSRIAPQSVAFQQRQRLARRLEAATRAICQFKSTFRSKRESDPRSVAQAVAKLAWILSGHTPALDETRICGPITNPCAVPLVLRR